MADSGVSTKPAAMRLTRIGAISSARVAVSGGSAAAAGAKAPMPGATRSPAAPMNSSVPPGRTLPTAFLATLTISVA